MVLRKGIIFVYVWIRVGAYTCLLCVCVCLYECVCVCMQLPRGVSDRLRERGGTLIHIEGEITVEHGSRCHKERDLRLYTDVTVLSYCTVLPPL